jgi:hypothetical protein
MNAKIRYLILIILGIFFVIAISPEVKAVDYIFNDAVISWGNLSNEAPADVDWNYSVDENWGLRPFWANQNKYAYVYENVSYVGNIVNWSASFASSGSGANWNISYWNYTLNNWQLLTNGVAVAGIILVNVTVNSDGLSGGVLRIRTGTLSGGSAQWTSYYEGAVLYGSSDNIITISSPLNQSYRATVPLNITGNNSAYNLCYYSLNGLPNVTMTADTNASYWNSTLSLAEDSYKLVVSCRDTGNMWNATTRYFATDTTSPSVTIEVPYSNQTYRMTNLPLNYTVNPAMGSGTANCSYSINSQTNITLLNCQNTQTYGQIGESSGMIYGNNSIRVHVNDSVNNIGYATREFHIFPIIGLCNSTMNVPYINFTFRDETNNSVLNGSISSMHLTYWFDNVNFNETFSYVSTTASINHTFCSSSNVTKVNSSYSSVTYSSQGYLQRQLTSAVSQTLSNQTTTKVLYLLGLADGSYTTFQVLDSSSSSPIQGVAVSDSVFIGGTNITTQESSTDASGAVTFWVNPLIENTFTFTKEGYSAYSFTVRPSQPNYQVILSKSSSVQNGTTEGIRWVTVPPIGRIYPNLEYLFGANISASLNNLLGCKFELADENETIFNQSQTGCASSGGFVGVWFNTTEYQKFYGRIYINTSGTWYRIDADAFWFASNVSSNVGIAGALADLRNLGSEWFGTGNEASFSRFMLAFILIYIITAFVTKTTGFDAKYDFASFWIVFPLIFMFSSAGFFTYDNMTKIPGISPVANAVMDKWMFFAVSSLLMVSYFLYQINRRAT